jgi:hypothetical protein
MSSNSSFPRWIWGLFFLPILLMAVSAYRLNQVIPPFFSPDEPTHFLMGARTKKSPEIENGLFKCSPLTDFIGSVSIQNLYLEKSKRFEGWESLNDSSPVAEKCGAYPGHTAYMESFSYPQVFVAKILLFGTNDIKNLSKTQVRDLYLMSRFVAFLLVLLLVFSAFLRFYLKPSALHMLGYLGSLALIAIPINFHQMVSISSDVSLLVATLGLGLLLVSSEIPPRSEGKFKRIFFISERSYILSFLFFATITKPILMGVLVAALAHFIFKNKRINFVSWVLIFICAATFVKGIFFYLKGIDAGNPDFANPVLQKQYILEHPFRVANAVIRSTFGRMFGIYDATLAWLNYRTPQTTKIISYLIFIGWIALVIRLRIPKAYRPARTKKTDSKNIYEGLFVFVGIFIFNFLTGLAMYIVHTPVGDSRVGGLQMRYFAPLWIFGLFYFLSVFRGRLKEQEFNLKPYSYITASMGILIFIEIYILEKSILRDYW